MVSVKKLAAITSSGAPVVGVLLLLALLLVPAAPASASPTVTVSTAAGDRYTAGQPVALLVEISADRAIEGTIRVRTDGQESTVKDFEVAGGATKTVIVVADTVVWGGDLTVEVRSSDGNTTVRPRLNDDRESELVGILASMQGRGIPATVRITGDRVARTYDIGENTLNAGAGAVDMFDSLVASSQDIATFSPAALAEVIQWLAGGGTLVMNDPPGTAIGALGLDAAVSTVELAAETAASQTFGFGRVVYSDGAVGRGQLDGLLTPGATGSRNEFGQRFNPGFSAQILLRDAGIRIPGIGALLALVGVYILIVGPGLFLFLRRSQRQPLLWFAIPLVAVATVGVVYGVGRAQRSDVDLAHATIIASVDGVGIERSEVLVASANGGFAGVRADNGFRSAGRTVDQFGQQSSQTPEARGDTIGFDLAPGAVSRLLLQRITLPADPETAPVLELDLELGDRTLSGTVTNSGDVELVEVQVVAGNDVVNLRSLAPGETKDLSFDDRFAFVPTADDSLFNQMEQDFFNDFQNAQEASAVNAGAFNDFVTRYPRSRSAGRVMALGWTRDVAAPVLTADGREIAKGRTAFVTVQTIAGDGEPAVAYGESSSEMQRVFDFEMEGQRNGLMIEVPIELHMRLPADAPANGRYLLEVPADVATVEVWDGSVWVVLDVRFVAAAAGRDSIALLKPGEILNRTVQVRAGFSQFGRSATPVLRSATDAELARGTEPDGQSTEEDSA